MGSSDTSSTGGVISLLADHPISRRWTKSNSPVTFLQLDGFSDTSSTGGVIYLRLLHQDTTASTMILTARSRVAPLKVISIPWLELCAAHLTAKLLRVTAFAVRAVLFRAGEVDT